MTTDYRDILWNAGAAVVCILLISFGSGRALLALGALPLGLFLPGWSFWCAVDPYHQVLDLMERLLWSVVLSIIVVMAGGFVLNEVSGLDRVSWSIWLGGVVGLLLVIATYRRRVGVHNPSTIDHGRPSSIDHVGIDSRPVDDPADGAPAERRFRRTSWTVGGIGAIGVALAMMIGAVALSQNSVSTTNPPVLEMWMIPVPLSEGSNASAAKLGVENASDSPVDLIVRVAEGGKNVSDFELNGLAPGQSWNHPIARSGNVPVLATLYYASDPEQVIRSVNLASPASVKN